jgi:hypothetical protein
MRRQFPFHRYIYDPDNPQYVSSIPAGGGGGISDIAVHKGYAYVTSWTGEPEFKVVDLSTGSVVYSFGSMAYGVDLDIGADYAHAYVADRYSGLSLINIFPDPPILMDFCDTPGIAEDVAVSGNYAFVADGAGGLSVIDITVPNIPTNIVACDLSSNAAGVAVTGNYAFVAAGANGIKTIDLLLSN